MKKTSLFSLFLATLLMLSSCGIIIINKGDGDITSEDGANETDISHPTYETQYYPLVSETDGKEISAQRLEALPDIDFDGKSVIFAVATETGDIMFEDEGTYSRAALYRNKLVADKYNTKIVVIKKSASELLTDVKNAEKSGDYYSDFAVIRYTDVGKYYAANYLRNIKSLSFAELTDDKSYDPRAIEQLTFGSFTAGVSGYATEALEHYSCLYYNKEYAEKLGMGLDYSMIYSGEFTWEKLFEIMKTAPKDSNSFVSSLNNDGLIRASFFSTGQTYLSPNNGKLGISCATESSTKLVSYLKKLLPLRKDSIKKEVPSGAAEETGNTTVTIKGFDIFLEGEALFAFGALGDMARLTNCGFRWEALPLPKIDESEESYSTGVSSDAPIITALASGENIDSVGYVLRALNSASFGYLKNEFYRDVQKNSITGVRTLDMIDLISENPIYDVAEMFGSSSSSLRNGTYNCLVSAVKEKMGFEYYLSRNASALNIYLNSLT